MFSVYYDKKIAPEVLRLSKININFHAGRLPEYRGCFSSVWSIINDEKKTASTAHIMEESVDTGDIVGVKEVEIKPDDTGKELYFRVTEATTQLFKEIHESLKKGKLKREPQPKGGHYYPRALPFDGIINWSESATFIHNFIRAIYFPPYLPAKTYFRGEGIYIYESSIAKGDYAGFEPGQICDIDDKGIIVETKKGGILIEKVQIDKKDASIRDFVRGYGVKIGDFLGK